MEFAAITRTTGRPVSVGSKSHGRRAGKCLLAQRRHRPIAEMLEARSLFSALMLNVDTFADTSSILPSNQVSLRGALNASLLADNVTIVVPAGTYKLNPALGPLAYYFPSTLTIQCVSGSATIDANGVSSAFSFGAGTKVSLSGLTIRGGKATNGGAVYSAGASLSVTDCTIAGNSATGKGGAIFNTGAALTVTDSTISGNTASKGAGIYDDSGSVLIEGSTINGNSAASLGGGTFDHSGQLTIINSTLAGNAGLQGGAVFNQLGMLSVGDSTIAGNTATQAGAAGGVESLVGGALKGDIIAGDKGGPDLVAESAAFSGANDLIGDGSGHLTGPTILTGAARLLPLGNYGGPTQTMPPAAGSPVIGRGLAAPSSVDQRGFPRNHDATDIGAVDGDVLTVNTFADTASPNVPSLRNALAKAKASHRNSVIILPGGTYLITLGALPIDDPGAAVQIQAMTGQATLNAQDHSSIFAVTATTTTNLAGLTLTGGKSAKIGGAVFSQGNLSVLNCKVSGNVAAEGGGIAELGGLLTIKQSTISNNTGTNGGGGVYLEKSNAASAIVDSVISGNHTTNAAALGAGLLASGGGLTVLRTRISGNIAPQFGNGGGIASIFGALDVVNSTISGNAANGTGGGLYGGLFGSVTVAGCAFNSNSASAGGAIDLSNDTALVTESTFTANSAKFEGGAIENFSTLSISHSTISGNSASTASAIYTSTQGSGPGQVTLTDTLAAGNLGISQLQATSGGAFTGSYNLIGDGTGGLSPGNGNILGTAASPINPLLTPLGNYGGPTQTMPLLPGSPALFAGTPSGFTGVGFTNPTNDQRGFLNLGTFAGLPLSIGAFQSFGFNVTVSDNKQSTHTRSAFQDLAVTVTSLDPFFTNLTGGVVKLVAPTNGASAILGTPAPLNAADKTTVTATANAIGGTYLIDYPVSPDLSYVVATLTNVATVDTTLTIAGLNQTYNGSPRLVTVTTNPPGVAGVTVTYTQNGVPVTNPTNAGTYLVTATLNNPAHAALSVTGTLVIGKVTPALTVTPVNAIPDTNVVLFATLTTPSGAPLVGKTITFMENGVSVGTAVTDADGTARLEAFISPAPGNYPAGLTAMFAGDLNSTMATGKAALFVF